MKIQFLIMILIITQSFAQEQKDSIVLNKYVRGDPFTEMIDAEIEIAKNWGFIINYSYGDCSGTYDYKITEFKKKNVIAKKSLKKKYDKNWETIFNNEVFINTHTWFIEYDSKIKILVSDKLKLNFDKGKSNIIFKPNRKFTLWTDFRTEKNEILTTPYNGSFIIDANTIRLKFESETELIYSYDIVNRNEVILTRKK